MPPRACPLPTWSRACLTALRESADFWTACQECVDPDVKTPTPTAAARMQATGTSASPMRRRRPVRRQRARSCLVASGGSGSRSTIARTRSRSSGLAVTSPARSSRTRSSKRSSITSGTDIVPHSLLELLQRAVEPRRARRRADPEQAGGSLPVEVEEHAQGDHLALARGQALERSLDRGREAVAENVAL